MQVGTVKNFFLSFINGQNDLINFYQFLSDETLLVYSSYHEVDNIELLTTVRPEKKKFDLSEGGQTFCRNDFLEMPNF